MYFIAGFNVPSILEVSRAGIWEFSPPTHALSATRTVTPLYSTRHKIVTRSSQDRNKVVNLSSDNSNTIV